MVKAAQAFLILVCSIAYARAQAPNSAWVYPGPDGKLVYKTLRAGDRIMDFSFAGYGGGGVAIPDVPTKTTVKPSGDDSAVIQKALDDVAAMPLVDGHRGAVELGEGTFNCTNTLNITASGVVLRGSDGTVLNLTGSPHVAIIVSGKQAITPSGKSTTITDSYVPSGTDSFSVADASGLSPGDTIQITRPVTRNWVAFMGMNKLVRNGKAQKWVSGKLDAERVIQSVSSNRITVTVPLADSYDSQYLNPPGTAVTKVDIAGLTRQVGIEHLRIESPPQAIPITAPAFIALQFNDVTDCWARDLDINDTINSTDISSGSSRITMQRINITHTVATLGEAKPEDFGDHGTQVLYDHCTGKGNNLFYFATFGRTQGPNVLLNCEFHGNGHIQPHMRWSTGLLYDNCSVPTSGIDLMNRGVMGSGHGWAIGWGVAWNCVAKTFLIQQPPGSMTWAIGCRGIEQSGSMPGAGGATVPAGKGPDLPRGIVDSPGVAVAPASLYLAQLKERLGAEALKNIGY